MTQATNFELDFSEAPKPKEKYVGQIAAPRQINMMTRPAYVPPKRVMRADAPDCSVRAWPSHYGKV